jgi:hypothetical protein
MTVTYARGHAHSGSSRSRQAQSFARYDLKVSAT